MGRISLMLIISREKAVYVDDDDLLQLESGRRMCQSIPKAQI